MCARPNQSFLRLPPFLNTPFFSHSWPEQRKGRSGICQRICCQYSRLAHERRTARRRRAKSRALRHTPLPPNAFPLSPTSATTAPASKRPRARARTPFSLAPSFAFAATAAFPAPRAGRTGLQQPHIPQRLVPPRTARAASAPTAPATAGRLSAALAHAFSVADTPAWWCAGYEEEVAQLRAWRVWS
jgi:hypothetical protein